MNIDGGTTEDLVEDAEVTISINAFIVEVGGNYVVVDIGNGNELIISEGSDWFIEL